MGDTEQETLFNVTACEVDFDDECFEEITDSAKEFITKLLSRQERYEQHSTIANANKFNRNLVQRA